MSSLKYKLRKLLPSLKLDAALIKDREVLERWRPIKFIIESPQNIIHACAHRKVSTDFFYKWGNQLLVEGSLSALKSGSKTPILQPNKTSKRIERKILLLRRAEPYHGCDRISADLKTLYNINCPPSTVNGVLRRNDLISKKAAKKLTKKHTKRYRRPMPGYLQMDFKYVPFKIGARQYYQLSCVDHHSSWRHIRCYEAKSTDYVMQFLNELIEEAPFPILQIQTDNDTAFTDKYSSGLGKPTGIHDVDIWCNKHNIEHKLIPIGQKEINGKVENTHKQDDREFFSQINPSTLKAIQQATIGYNYRWNNVRRTKTLNRHTPSEVVRNSYVFTLAYLKIMSERFSTGEKPLLQMISTGDLVHKLRTKKSVKKTKNRTKRISLVNRYLQYLKWDENNCVLFMSPIYLNSTDLEPTSRSLNLSTHIHQLSLK